VAGRDIDLSTLLGCAAFGCLAVALLLSHQPPRSPQTIRQANIPSPRGTVRPGRRVVAATCQPAACLERECCETTAERIPDRASTAPLDPLYALTPCIREAPKPLSRDTPHARWASATFFSNRGCKRQVKAQLPLRKPCGSEPIFRVCCTPAGCQWTLTKTRQSTR
jgi:hypothetical protein